MEWNKKRGPIAGRKPNPDSLQSITRARGVPYSTVYERLRAGLSLEDALSLPRQGGVRLDGKSRSAPR